MVPLVNGDNCQRNTFMQFVDTHTHLYSTAFLNDSNEMIERALAAGVGHMYLPAIDSGTHTAMLELCAQHHQLVPMMGLHPCSVRENWEAELGIVRQHLERQTFAAIGETGLDLYWDTHFFEEQKAALRQQAELAIAYDLPIVLHTRNATAETIEEIRPFVQRGLRGVFHCFSGTLEEARAITGMGFFIGIGGVLTYKKSELPAIVQQLQPEFLVLETDAPYLPPVPYRGKRNESAYLPLVAEKLAAVLELPLAEIAHITTQNAFRLFAKKG